MSEERVTLLVLGVGGNVSQGILKALALSGLPCRVIGACISPLAFGLYTTDRAYVSPRADDPDFVDWLIRICRAEGVKGILSGVEPVLAVLSRNAARVLQESGAVSLVCPPDILDITGDKLSTCEWLKEQGFAFPRFADSADGAAVDRLVTRFGYPVIAKLRKSKSSEGVLVVKDAHELDWVRGRPGYVVEEYLGDARHEYTAACFSDDQGRVRGAIVMRRELLQGTSYRVEAGLFPEIRAEAIRIATALRPTGSCNMQFRTSGERPVCFEINARFSGTTPFRARWGFNDVAAAIRHYVLGEPAVDLPLVTSGLAVRYWNEAYLDPETHARLNECSFLEDPHTYPVLLENYGERH